MTTRYQKLTSHDEDENFVATSSGSSSSSTNNNNNSTQPSQQRSAQTQQLNDLQDTFGETFDEEEEEHSAVTDRLLRSNNDNNNNNNSSHISIPMPQPSSSSLHTNGPAILPVSTDGVFSNISAKPESDSKKLEETPPTYEEAAADATPPYWQTTIIAPAGMGDIVLVEGMPVGNIFAFFWNLLISASFQFVGFMLTYLLHTSHASKQGSRAGLGVSLVQTGFYIRSRGTLEDDDYYYSSNDESQDNKNNENQLDGMDADIIAYLLMIIGWFIIIRSIADYFRAKQMEKIIRSEPNPEANV
ncbi:hypothetical protein G6F68_005851 [Rhizopus microsporus]|nr:hypothetical protein G6F67_006481 [Rhizopus microsporus]KAG1262548.1 hypothetical protein G6F68_005851 [Rhizopus microsporus]